MATDKQKLGEYGEKLVCKLCSCPQCKRSGMFKRLPNNFKCLDLICEFCTNVVQVKTSNQPNISKIPSSVPGGGWKWQEERLNSSWYTSLFLVVVNKKDKTNFAIYFLSKEVQRREMYVKRLKPLAPGTRREGWLGFNFKFSDSDKKLFVKLI